MTGGALLLGTIVVALGCDRVDLGAPFGGAAEPTAESGVPSASPPTPSASAEAGAAVDLSPDALRHAVDAMPLSGGFVGVVRRDASDEAIAKPLVLVEREGMAAPRRTELPFSSEQLVGSNLGSRRFAWILDTPRGDREVRLWQAGGESEALAGAFVSAAVARTQALVATGRRDRFGMLSRSDGHKIARFSKDGWTWLELPRQPPRWADCAWDMQPQPESDDFVLLQICQAPSRPLAYAVYRLQADSTKFVRIPFDTELFEPVGAFRGNFTVEANGVISLSAGTPKRFTLARYFPEKKAWKDFDVAAEAGLASSIGVFGSHILFASGLEGKGLRESLDGGHTFRDVDPVPGMLHGCYAAGCTFITARTKADEARVIFRPWSAPTQPGL